MSEDGETIPWRAEGPTPAPNALARSGRCQARSGVRDWQAGRPKSKWPRDFCAAKRLGASCGRPGSAFGGWFWAKRKGAWASRSPKRTILGQNRPFKARFKRRAQPEARIGGGVGLAAICRVPHSRAPRPEARRRRAQERGRVPRRTPPTFAERVPATKCAGKRVHPQPSRGSRPRSVSG